jgi:hypothetical protein
VNAIITATYWLVGRRIVEQEQVGEPGRTTAKRFSNASPAT